MRMPRSENRPMPGRHRPSFSRTDVMYLFDFEKDCVTLDRLKACLDECPEIEVWCGQDEAGGRRGSNEESLIIYWQLYS